MNSNQKTRKAKAGLLLIASPRFKTLGEGLRRGTYAERKDADVKKILATMEFLDVVFPGIVYDKEEAVEAMDRFYMEKVDFVIAEFLSWSEDFAWIRFLRDMPEVPILFVNVAKDHVSFRDTLDEDDFIDYLCAGTLVGSLEASGSVPRTGRRHVKVVMGSREEVTGQIRLFASAARARAILRQSNLGLLANYNEAMWSTYIDPYDLFTKLGPEIRFLPYSTYGEMIDAVSDEELQAYCGELTSRYKMMDDVARDKFEASVRASIGLQKMAERSDIDVMVFNDIDRAMFELVGLRAGFYHPWFNDNCSVLVPEADIGAGLITYLLKLISGKKRQLPRTLPHRVRLRHLRRRPCRSQRPQRPRLAAECGHRPRRALRQDLLQVRRGSVRLVPHLAGAQDNGAAGGVRRTLQAGRHAGRFARRRSHPGHLFAQHLPPGGSRRAALRRDPENRHHAAFRHR